VSRVEARTTATGLVIGVTDFSVEEALRHSVCQRVLFNGGPSRSQQVAARGWRLAERAVQHVGAEAAAKSVALGV
jgi:hypothetical protein